VADVPSEVRLTPPQDTKETKPLTFYSAAYDIFTLLPQLAYADAENVSALRFATINCDDAFCFVYKSSEKVFISNPDTEWQLCSVVSWFN
jgi:hypothetical protein